MKFKLRWNVGDTQGKDEFGIHFKAAQAFVQSHHAGISELHQVSGVEKARSHNRQNGRDMQQKAFVKEFAGSG